MKDIMVKDRPGKYPTGAKIRREEKANILLIFAFIFFFFATTALILGLMGKGEAFGYPDAYKWIVMCCSYMGGGIMFLRDWVMKR